MVSLHAHCVTPLKATALAWLLPAVASLTSTNSVAKANQGFGIPGAAPASVPANAPAPALAKPCFEKMPLKAQEQGFDGETVIHQDGQSYTSDWMKEYGADVTKDEKEKEGSRPNVQLPGGLGPAIYTIPERMSDAVRTVPIPGVKSFGIRAIANLWATFAFAAASSF